MTNHEMALSDEYRESIQPIVLELNDPGGPIMRDSQGRWIMSQPWADFWNPPHTGTTRRTKRLTAIGIVMT